MKENPQNNASHCLTQLAIEKGETAWNVANWHLWNILHQILYRPQGIGVTYVHSVTLRLLRLCLPSLTVTVQQAIFQLECHYSRRNGGNDIVLYTNIL